MSVTDTDHGYAALVERVFGLAQQKPVITIGIHEEEGAGAHPTEDEIEETVTILLVAIFNEFGTSDGHVPERSFIRAWFDEAEPELRKDLVTLMRSVVAGKRTSREILELMGQRAVGQIQQRISSGIAPPNAPSTIRQKGSSTPLIDSGILRSSVTYKIEGAD